MSRINRYYLCKIYCLLGYIFFSQNIQCFAKNRGFFSLHFTVFWGHINSPRGLPWEYLWRENKLWKRIMLFQLWVILPWVILLRFIQNLLMLIILSFLWFTRALGKKIFRYPTRVKFVTNCISESVYSVYCVVYSDLWTMCCVCLSG